MALDQDYNFYLKPLSNLFTCLMNNTWILKEKLCVNHLWELSLTIKRYAATATLSTVTITLAPPEFIS